MEKFRTVLVLLIHAVAASSKVFEVKNSWNSGFQGVINIPIKTNIEDGWKLEIKFHEKLGGFKLWSGELITAEQGQSGSKYVFVNYPYNKALQRGEVFEVEFTGDLMDNSGPRVPPVTVKFQHRVIYSDYYDTTSDSGITSTIDIVSVINGLTRTTTEAAKSTRPLTQKPSAPIHEIKVSTTQLVATSLGQNTTKPTDRTITEDNDQPTKESINNTEIAVNHVTTADEEEGEGSGVESETKPSPNSKWKAKKTRYSYAEVIHKSVLFYEAQRSGRLPEDNRIKWRGDSALNDTGHKGEDLTGGYYDAGDHVKFTFPMAFSMTTLSWGLIEYWEAYQHAGELENALKAIKWGIDHIVKSYVGKYELYGQVGKGKEDHEYWGRPEEMKMRRPAFKITSSNPGSDLAAECSAALSAASLAFERSNIDPFADPKYITMLREKAESLYEFADKFRGKYDKAITDAIPFYPSYSYIDELLWARVWLYRSTGNNEHLKKAEGYYYNNKMFRIPGSMMFSWDDKAVGIQTLLSQVTGGERRIKYSDKANAYCRRIRRERTRFTKKGLLYMDEWSPLRYAANIAFICQMVGDLGLDWGPNFAFARKQIHYMLGDTGRSYVVGFGKRYPLTPHHRSSSCARPGCGREALESTNPNPHILHGALVGGPNRKDNYKDERKNYKTNEVALDHNSCFQGVVAALLQRSLIGVTTIKSRSHEPWYPDYLNYTAVARTATPPTTTSGSNAIRSKLYIAILFVCMTLGSFEIFFIK